MRFVAVVAVVAALTPLAPAVATAQRPTAAPAAAAQFPTTQLGVPTGAYAIEARAINNRGEVVGSALYQGTGGSLLLTEFVWAKSNGFTLLTLLPANALVIDINDRGVVLGYGYGGLSDPQYRAFTWTADHGITPLPAMIPRSINNSGDVAGICGGNPCVVRHGELQRLSLPDATAFGSADAINEAGFVVGHVELRDAEREDGLTSLAALWDPAGEVTLLPPPPAGPGGVYETMAFDINNRGDILGQRIDDPDEPKAKILTWASTAGHPLTRVGTGTDVNSFPRALNEAGVVLADTLDDLQVSFGIAIGPDGSSVTLDDVAPRSE